MVRLSMRYVLRYVSNSLCGYILCLKQTAREEKDDRSFPLSMLAIM